MRIPAVGRGVLVILYSISVFELILFVMLAEQLYILSTFLFIMMCMVTAIFVFLMVGMIFDGTFTDAIVISKEGIKLEMKKKTYGIEWREIRMIGVTTHYKTKPLNIIIFSKKYEPQKLHLIPKRKKQSNDLLYIKNRRGLIQEIMKHWDGKIINGEKNKY